MCEGTPPSGRTSISYWTHLRGYKSKICTERLTDLVINCIPAFIPIGQAKARGSRPRASRTDSGEPKVRPAVRAYEAKSILSITNSICMCEGTNRRRACRRHARSAVPKGGPEASFRCRRTRSVRRGIGKI